MPFSLHILLVILFIDVVKRSNSRSQMLFNPGVPKNFAIFTGKHRKAAVLESFVNKVTGLKVYIFIEKETPTLVSSSEYCKIFKSIFFMEHLFIILFLNFM